MMTEVERLRRSVDTLADQLEEITERNRALEAYLAKQIGPAIEDLEKQHRKKGYYHANKDTNYYMAGVVEGYRELFPKEGEQIGT